MKLELYLQNSNTGKIYDISGVAGQIEVTSSITGEAGKLSCVLQKDPNNLLEIANGSHVSFIVDGYGMFYGYVFMVGTDAEQNYKITCYDQMRYLKNSDIMTTANMTSSDIFAKVCNDYNLRYEIRVPTNYIPEPYIHDSKTLYSIIERGIQYANINDKKMYFIRDEFGTLVWSELGNEKTNIQIGEGSLLLGYKYEKSIDDDSYNQIKMFKEDKQAGKRQIWLVKDSNNIKRWGILQMLHKADDELNEAQIKQMAEDYLKVKNRETEKLTLQANGVKELTAGKGIKFVLEREKIDKWMWIISSKHTFTKYEHTMELEVEI